MRLFHVSADPGITIFCPRPAETRSSVIGEVVWAVDEAHLANYLLPRDCPRVCFTLTNNTAEEDRLQFGVSKDRPRVIAIERSWLERLKTCTLYLYELPTTSFELSDATAGCYVSRNAVCPLVMTEIRALGELRKRNVDLRTPDNLWDLHDAIATSTLSFSMIRMRNAGPRINR